MVKKIYTSIVGYNTTEDAPLKQVLDAKISPIPSEVFKAQDEFFEKHFMSYHMFGKWSEEAVAAFVARKGLNRAQYTYFTVGA